MVVHLPKVHRRQIYCHIHRQHAARDENILSMLYKVVEVHRQPTSEQLQVGSVVLLYRRFPCHVRIAHLALGGTGNSGGRCCAEAIVFRIDDIGVGQIEEARVVARDVVTHLTVGNSYFEVVYHRFQGLEEILLGDNPTQ